MRLIGLVVLTLCLLLAPFVADAQPAENTRFAFAVNLKTAEALGLTIPQTLLLRAGQIIEFDQRGQPLRAAVGFATLAALPAHWGLA